MNRLERTLAKEDVVGCRGYSPRWEERWPYTRLQRLVWKMNLFEKEEKRRYAEWETERILVAFGKPKPTVVVFAGPAFEYENDEAFTGLEDLLEGDGAPGLGIWVWEGKPRPQFGCGEWGDEFDGYEYDGTWREPTEEELKAGMGGDNPWTIPCPACSNLPETPVEPTEAGAVDTTWKSIPTCKECDGRGEVPRT